MTEQGWYADPTNRRFKRWYDGSTWTRHTVGPDGAIAEDPLRPDDGDPAAPGTSTPAPVPAQPSQQQPPSQHQPPSQQPPSQQSPFQQPWQSPQPGGWGGPGFGGPGPSAPGFGGSGWGGPGSRETYGPGPGLAVAALGAICLLLSLFALKWGDGRQSTFLDFGRAARAVPSSVDLDTGPQIAVLYASWAAFVLFGLALVLAVLAGVPLPQSAAGNTYARVAGAVVIGLGAIGQTITITQVFKGDPTPQFGAWLGVAGWIVLGVAFALGARRRTR